jgi:RNA processing factor Prp31
MASELRRLASLAQLSDDVREARIARLEAWQAAVAVRIDRIQARVRAESAELRARLDRILPKVK